jgi:DNA polymerase-3 subunit alpha
MDTKRAEAVGQFDLFGSADADMDAQEGGVRDGSAGDGHLGMNGMSVAVPPGEWQKSTLLAFERDMLGLYVSDHPLHGVEHVLSAFADTSIAALHAEGVSDGSIVTVAGMLTNVQRRVTKQGAAWASAVLEDLEAGVEVLCFPRTYEQVGVNIAEDAIVVVKGRVDRREDVPRVVAMDLTLADLSSSGPAGPLVITLPAARCTQPVVERLNEVLKAHPGVCEVHLHLAHGARTTVLRLDDGLRVTASTALMGDLKALLGAGSVSMAGSTSGDAPESAGTASSAGTAASAGRSR